MSDAPLTTEQSDRVDRAMGMVHRVADWLLARYRGVLERDELISHGYEGLVQAARRYDVGLGVPFEGYAWSRVHGAMMSAVSKEIGSRALPAMRKALYNLTSTLRDDADPLDGEEDAERTLSELTASMVAALFVASVGPPSNASDAPGAKRDEFGRAVEVLEHAIADMPDEEQQLIVRHYFEDAQLKDIASDLGLSYATARRRHHRALQRLGRALMRHDIDKSALADAP